ncbi:MULTISPECIES: hypothetical protein [Streptomyces]|uniref:Uncharacterized protein n=1 Tax=Streptomyces siderophoricus TaxID=2802281 RepID=A0ABS1MTJ1_9ACTN|nr:hypothetical protein [Streptomyces sp. 9-7]MBL1091063.1 hypothetical protein [Streptomyces sp. 9-7]
MSAAAAARPSGTCPDAAGRPGPARLGPGGGWSWFVEAGWAMHADGVGWRVTQQVVQ